MWDFLKYIFGDLILKRHSWGFAYFQACINSLNIFMNFVKNPWQEAE